MLADDTLRAMNIALDPLLIGKDEQRANHDAASHDRVTRCNAEHQYRGQHRGACKRLR